MAKASTMEQHQQQRNNCDGNNGGKRVPLLLQVVLLNGNRGKEVNTPPPDASAMKVFSRANTNGPGSRWRPFRSWSSGIMPFRNSAAPGKVSSLETETIKKANPVHKIKRNKVSALRSAINVDNILEKLHRKQANTYFISTVSFTLCTYRAHQSHPYHHKIIWMV
jgi:hypothetical protein